jgi:hypothetical protein
MLSDIVSRFAPTRVKEFETKLAEKDIRGCVSVLHDAWFNAPDQPWIRSIPGWMVLCDLCSDAPEEEPANGT